jgi:chromosome segregation ATPase
LESGRGGPELVDIDELINKINTKETLLEKRRKDYQSLEASQNTYKCPSCSSLLKMKGIILHKCEDDIQTVSGDLDSVQDDINCLTRDVQKLNKERSKYDHRRADREETEAQINDILKQYEERPVLEELEGDLEYLLDYKASQKELSKKLDKLTSKIERGEMSSACEMFKKKVSQLRRKLDQLEGDSRVGETLEIEDRDLLTTLIDKEKDDKLSMRNLCKNIKRMEDELSNTVSEVSRKSEMHIETYGKVRSVNHIETYVKKYKDEINRLNTKREEHASNIEKIEEWQRYQEKLTAYKKLVTQADQLSHKEKEDRKKYGAMMTLKQKILEAESLVLLNIIDIINTHARTYLDAFFPDNPISVQLTPFKTTKKTTKPSISVQIEYKGMECDMHMLSGGELSRVVLAYTLALAEMFNTPLLMLDECTASLDQDMTGVVFDAIRDNFSGKLVLIIAHQVISGTFDKVVKL